MKLRSIILGGVTLLIFALNANSAHAQSPEQTKPVSIALVNQSKKITDWEVGDIEVTLSDGHKELLTKGQKCGRPHLSPTGAVGWSLWNDFDPANTASHTGETLHLRLPGGSVRDFKPNSRFIMAWNFVDGGASVVIASMGYHGSQFYIKYDVATGKVLGQIDEYKPYAELPKWAQPFSDDKP